MYKCPFCQSADCTELRDCGMPQLNTTNSFLGTGFYDDGLVEIRCNQCGIVTKIDPHYYNTKDDKPNKNE